MALDALGFALAFAASAAAGWGVARRTLGRCIDEEHRLLAAVVTGMLVTAAATFAGAAAGAVLPALAVGLIVGLRLLGTDGCTELVVAARTSGVRWLGWIAVAVAWTALVQGRTISIDDGSWSWRGTTGWETWMGVNRARAVADGAPFLSPGPWPAERMNHHLGVHAAAGGWSAMSGADLAVVFARLLPAALFAAAFEAHRSFLRTWFPAGRAIACAALLPAVVSDLDPWIRLAGLRPLPEFEHRLPSSFAASPSFVLGQTIAAFVLGLLARAGRASSLPAREAAWLGVFLGLTAGLKLPSFVMAAIAVAAAAPWIARRCGARALSAGAAGALVAAMVCAWACFPALLGGGGLPGNAPAFRFAPLHPFDPARTGVTSAAGIAALACLWIVQSAGPRLLRLADILRARRADGSWTLVLAPLVAGATLPLLFDIPPGEEEKYFSRCGGEIALLVTGALVFAGLRAGSPVRGTDDAGPRPRGVVRSRIETAALLLLCAGTARMLRPGPPECVLEREVLAACERLRARGATVVVDASVSDRLGHAVTAISGLRARREGTAGHAAPDAVLAAAEDEVRAGFRVIARGSAVCVAVRE